MSKRERLSTQEKKERKDNKYTGPDEGDDRRKAQ